MTSPVREALYRGDRAAAEAAAEAADLDVFDAAALGRVDRLRELLDAEPQLVQELSDDGFTALHLACFGAGADTVRLLVEREAPLERLAEAPFARVRPLGTAVFAGNLDAARILLEAGADPNGGDSREHRPLQTAEANGNEALAGLLREHGATLPG
jgi:ankyrin repeat protein